MNETPSPPQLVSYGRRLSDLAAAHPDTTAVVFAPRQGAEVHSSWRDLDRRSNQIARLLLERTGGAHGLVVVALPNGPEHVAVTYAAWKLGATVLPLRWDLPDWERARILELADPAVVIADWEAAPGALVASAELSAVADRRADPLPDRIAEPGFCIGTGGSTGRPKIIRVAAPAAGVPGKLLDGGLFGWRGGQVQLVSGPLYHVSAFRYLHVGLFEDQTIVLSERFEAARAVDLIERHRVNCTVMVPTMLYRLLRVPGIERRDFSSIVSFACGGSLMPRWVMQAWIDILGGERIWESYGSTEGHGFTLIRGDEWLLHPGSVGRPVATELRIRDQSGADLPAGEIGEIYMRPAGSPAPTFEYIGAEPRVADDGLVSVGDLGWLDADGYLFIADRRVDMIISGGANVYPAEIEAALSEHPGVTDCAVIGLPDPDLGRRVHALVLPAGGAAPPSAVELDLHCRQRLVRYKVPRSFELVNALPRDDVGKIRRSALQAEREPQTESRTE